MSAKSNSALVSWVFQELNRMHQYRRQIGFDTRLRMCLQQRLGEYDAHTLQEISKIEDGCKLFLQMTASKCRAAAGMLRDVFITNERPWTIGPTPVPDTDGPTPEELAARAYADIEQLTQAGVVMPPEVVQRRVMATFETGMRETRDMAARRIEAASRFIDDMLQEGGFYEALNGFLEDFVTYPMAVLAGPRVVTENTVVWQNGTPVVKPVPRLRWDRVDPADFFWSPGARSMEHADVIERMPVSRTVLESLQNLSGYRADEVRAALRQYGPNGYTVQLDTHDEKAELENRPNHLSETGIFELLIYTGRLTGAQLKSFNLGLPRLPSSDTQSMLVTAVVCGDYLLKVQVDPDPLQRVGYFVAAYEPTPNSIVGNALPELFRDLQRASNAVLRAMINNVAIGSGPQVVINTDALIDQNMSKQPTPWKHWPVSGELSNSSPISFFQPNMNTGELLQLLSAFSMMADDVSGVPRYLAGNERVGGAGRTASGLAMLMGNSTRVMQSIAASIDVNVLRPALMKLYRMLMQTVGPNSPLRGDEMIVVRGATYARARESDRMRALEMLSLTANPIDMQLLGPEVRAYLLSQVAKHIGLDIPEDMLRAVMDRADLSTNAPPAEGAQTMGAQGQAGPMPPPGRSAIANPAQQMPPAEGLANPGVESDVRGLLRSRGVAVGPLSRRG